MGCIYKIKTDLGVTPELSEDQLGTVLRGLGINWTKQGASLIQDIVNAMSRGHVKYQILDETINYIESLLKEEKTNLKLKKELSEESLTFDNAISETELVERQHKNLNSFASATSIDDFVRESILNYKDSHGGEIPIEEEQKILRKAQMFEITQEDGRLLHGYSPSAFIHSIESNTEPNTSGYLEDLDNERSLFSSLCERFENPNVAIKAIDECMKNINLTINKILKPISSNGEKNKVKLGIHISAELKKDVIDGVSRVGTHIDRLYIDPNGHVHVFNFKFSQSKSKDWAIAKKEKYQLALAVIKSILKSRGINVVGASFYNIPITIKYDENTELDKNGMFKYPPKIIDLIPEVDSLINGNISNSGTRSPMAKNEAALSSLFPKTETYQEQLSRITFDFDLNKPAALISAVNPEYNAEKSGLLISAKAYIRSEKGKTINISDDGTHYEIILPNGNKLTTKSLNQQELFDIVNDHIEELSLKLPIIASEMIKSVESSYSLGRANFENFGFKHNAETISRILFPYFLRGKDEEPLWKPLLHDLLTQLGIFLFLHVNSGRIDVVKFSALKLNEKIPLRNKFLNNILGFYEMDMEGVTDLKTTYGDMELLYTTAILNELVPRLDNPKFGSIHIISPYFRGENNFRDAGYAIKEFNKIVKYLNNKKEVGYLFENNFNNSNIVDSFQCVIDQIEALKTYKDIPKYTMDINLENIKSASTEAAKVQGMMEIIEYFHNKWHTTNPDYILEKLNSPYKLDRILAQIYIDANVYCAKYLGFKRVQIKYINSFKRLVIRTDSNPDENYRFVGDLYAKMLDSLAFDFLKLYTPIRKEIMNFYDAVGFSSTELAVVGSATRVYNKMFKRSREDGKMLWLFVNPYNQDECLEYKLNKTEIDFLKRVLFHLAKTRAEGKGQEFNFTSINDSKLSEYIKKNADTYFLVPLLKRSSNAIKDIKDSWESTKRTVNKIKNSNNIKETLLEIFDRNHNIMMDDANKEESIYDFNIANLLLMSEDPEGREILLSQHNDDYFETNIEYILNEYIFSAMEYLHKKEFELKAKIILLIMHLQGNEAGPRSKRILNESIRYVDDFLKLNLYGKSLMSESGETFARMMLPARTMMSRVLIMGNLRSAFRDTFEGLMQNTVRTLSHFNSDLMTSNVYKAYGVVLKDLFHNERTLNIISELCLRYRLSNTDAAKVNERSKFGKGGLTDPTYLGYSTLRGPDMLNRMTLFVARCLQDGTFYAYDLKDNELVYNAADDERFKIFFQGLTEHPKYKESKAAYFSAVREWNANHRDEDKISYDITVNTLPEPYSFQDIESFKEFSNMIYAAYDKYAKSRYEFLALGQTLGVFSTWFNGITAAWLREKGEYLSHFRIRDKNGNILIKHNEAGNELYFDNDGNILEKRNDNTFWNDHNEQVEGVENEVVPVIDRVPILVQGIIGTFQDIWSVVLTDGFDSEAWKQKIWQYDSNRANIYRVSSDFLMMILFFCLFGSLFTKMYKNHKKKKEMDDLAVDLGIELVFKGGYNSFDGFLGPIAVFNYALNEMDPSAAKLNLLLINQAMRTITGKQSKGSFFYNNLPVFRSFKDTIKMHNPEAFKAPESD